MNREEIKNQLWECVTLYSGTIEDRYKFFDLLKEYREEDLLKISMLKIRKSKLKELKKLIIKCNKTHVENILYLNDEIDRIFKL